MTETFGNVVVEALASGLAVVAYAHAAADEHIQDGRDGLLARPGDPRHFVAQAQRAASDDRLRAAVRAGAAPVARALGWDAILEGLEQAMLRTARAAGGQPRAAYAAPRPSGSESR
jgi:glycosyltransferase involved in cell wall biosynthesis